MLVSGETACELHIWIRGRIPPPASMDLTLTLLEVPLYHRVDLLFQASSNKRRFGWRAVSYLTYHPPHDRAVYWPNIGGFRLIHTYP